MVSKLPFEKIFNIDSPQRRKERGEEVFLICGETTANQKGSSLPAAGRPSGNRHVARNAILKRGGFDPIVVSRWDQRHFPSAISASLR
jgi:hypothetical protein